MKSKFNIWDILFEPEEKEVIVEAPLKQIKKTEVEPQVKTITKEVAKPVTPQNKTVVVKNNETKDVLNNHGHSKSFGIIDVDELKVKKAPAAKPVVKKEEPIQYEYQPPISPIFGVLQDEEPKVLKTPQISSSNTTISSTSRLGTVLSPIFGLDLQKSEMRPSEPLKNDTLKDEAVDKDMNDEMTKIANDLSNAEITPIIVEEEGQEFKNAGLDEIIKYVDDTYVAEQAISLFDDYNEEDK